MGEALGEASTLRDAHVSPEQLARRKAGRLTPDENALIERHLAGCEGCRMATRLSDPFVATVETSPPLAAAKAGLAPTFSARYEIKRTLGSGGMGTVYEALDLQLHRLVALKLLRLAPADPAELEEAANRLVREARAMAALHHRNVVTVYDVGRHEDQVYVAMQLVDGPTLRGWLANGTRTVPEILGVLRDAGVGLAAAHRANLVHRDFKPDNVLISRKGTARVTDFGLARRADVGDDHTTLQDRASGPRVVALDAPSTITRSGLIVGTPAYMAPEQVTGEPCDPRADQFSYCVTAWEALFGARPFGGTTWSEIYANVIAGAVEEPRETRHVPRVVMRAMRRGLMVKPSDRFSSMDELTDTIENALRRPSRRRRWGQLIGLFAFGAVIATAVSFMVLHRVEPAAPLALADTAALAVTVTPI